MQIDHPVRRPLAQGQGVVRLERFDIGCRHAGNHVDIARQKRGDARRTRLDRTKVDFGPDRFFAPVLLVAHEACGLAGRIALELVGACSDRGHARVELFGRGTAADAVRNDRDGRHVVAHQRIGRLGLDMKRMVIDLHQVLALRVGREAGGRVRHVRRPLEGADHIIGGKIGAVVKLHALAQLEFPSQVVDRLPRYRQTGQKLLPLVLIDQPVKDMQRQGVVRPGIVELRIDRGGLGCKAHDEFLGRCNPGAECESSGRDGQNGRYLHVHSPCDRGSQGLPVPESQTAARARC